MSSRRHFFSCVLSKKFSVYVFVCSSCLVASASLTSSVWSAGRKGTWAC